MNKSGYEPLRGVRVLDMGWLLPPALLTQRLAALGADVVKVERPGRGDYLKEVGPFFAGASPIHMTMNCGKRSVALDLRVDADRECFFRLADVADVIVENALPGTWKAAGVDFAAMRARRPDLIVCSITGFGQTGPWARLPSHGLNMDSLADLLPLEWRDGEPHLEGVFTSWSSELGVAAAAMSICAALACVRSGGEGAWIDVSCWDAGVEAHRCEIAANVVTGTRMSYHGRELGAIYNVYPASDGQLILLGTLEPKFWNRFCRNVGREDLLAEGGAEQVDYGADRPYLAVELRGIIASANGDEWARRFLEWDLPGSRVLAIDQVMDTDHFKVRGIVEERGPTEYPVVTAPIRWHDHGGRAGSGLTLPPTTGAHNAEVVQDWLGDLSEPAAERKASA